jgi:hypothetical protein
LSQEYQNSEYRENPVDLQSSEMEQRQKELSNAMEEISKQFVPTNTMPEYTKVPFPSEIEFNVLQGRSFLEILKLRCRFIRYEDHKVFTHHISTSSLAVIQLGFLFTLTAVENSARENQTFFSVLASSVGAR